MEPSAGAVCASVPAYLLPACVFSAFCLPQHMRCCCKPGVLQLKWHHPPAACAGPARPPAGYDASAAYGGECIVFTTLRVLVHANTPCKIAAHV